MNLIDIFRMIHPNAEEYTFFSSADGTFSRIDHNLGHKSNLSKSKKIEIISNIFSDHNTMRLDISYKKKPVRNTNIWRLSNTFLNNEQVTEETKREIKKFLETNDNENTATQNLAPFLFPGSASVRALSQSVLGFLTFPSTRGHCEACFKCRPSL